MHTKPDLRVFLKWMITRSGSVITDVIPLNQKWCQHLNKNPYESPAEVDDNESARNPSSDAPSTEEAAENLRFTSQIVRGLSIFCGLAAAHSLLSLVMGYYYLGFSDGWNWFHTLTTVRGLAIPAFAILCRFSWCYASSLRDFANSFPSTKQFNYGNHVENLTWLWLALAFLAFTKIFDLCTQLAMAMYY